MNFSVLISIYYKENPTYLKEALDSVFAQTVLPSEIVLVEDGLLTAPLYNIISEYASRYPIFIIVKNETNLGLGKALAKGIEVCSNEYILRMDTDDVIPTDRFEKELIKLEEGYDVISCWSLLYEGAIDNVIAIKQRPEHHDDIVKLAHKRSPICHAGCAYKKSAVLDAGSYLHNPYYEDYDLWVRMILKGYKFYNIQEVLYYVRTSMEMTKRRVGWQYMKDEIKAFNRFHKLGFYTNFDVVRSICTHSIIRILPSWFRGYAMKRVWNYKSV